MNTKKFSTSRIRKFKKICTANPKIFNLFLEKCQVLLPLCMPYVTISAYHIDEDNIALLKIETQIQMEEW